MKAMYLVGEDMALVDSNANHVHEVLSSLDFFVVQDIFLSKMLRCCITSSAIS